MFWMVKFVPANLYIPRFKKSSLGTSAQQNRAMFYKYCSAVLKQQSASSSWKREDPENEFFNGFKYTTKEKADNMVRLFCDNLSVLPSQRYEVCEVVEFDSWPTEYIRYIANNPTRTHSSLVPQIEQAKTQFGTSFDYCSKCHAVVPPETFYMHVAGIRICGLCFIEMASSIEDSLRKLELENPDFYNRLHSARLVHHL